MIDSQATFEELLHKMFDHIWNCEINHPFFQDTVGDLMKAVMQAYNNLKTENYCVPYYGANMELEQERGADDGSD